MNWRLWLIKFFKNVVINYNTMYIIFIDIDKFFRHNQQYFLYRTIMIIESMMTILHITVRCGKRYDFLLPLYILLLYNRVKPPKINVCV